MNRRTFLKASSVAAVAAGSAAATRGRTFPGKCHDASDNVLVDYFAVGQALVPNRDFSKSGVRITLGIPTQLALANTPTGAELWLSNFTYKELEEQLTQMAKNCLLANGTEATAEQLEVKWKSAKLSAGEFDAVHSEFLAAFADYAAGAAAIYAEEGPTGMNAIYLDAWGFEVSYKTAYQEFSASVVQDLKKQPNVKMVAWLHHLNAIASAKFGHKFEDVMDES